MLKKQWALEAEADKEADRQKFILNRERNLELINHNAAERELREIQLNSDKQRDKELLEANLKREKAMMDLEEAAKQARRKEVIELQDYYKRAAEDKQAFEKAVDAEVAKEAERQFQMRDAQWQREDQARINLLKDVYYSREQDILLKQDKKKEGLYQKDYEKQ